MGLDYQPNPSDQPRSVRDGLFVRVARHIDTFLGHAFRSRNDILVGPDGTRVNDPDLEQKATLLGEKIYHAYVVGRLNFLAQNDGVSDETPAMRKEYWKWAVTEPALESALWTKVISVVSNQLVMRPASKSPYDKAVAEWAKDCIIRSAGGLRKIGEQIFYHGLVWGNVLVEPLWKISESPQWKPMFPYGYFTLKDCVARDPADYRLEIDGFRNIIGVWTQKTNEWFPPSYFIKWANRPIYGNPAGTSGVRSSRRACMLIKAAQTFRGIYLEQFGLPMLKGHYNRNDDQGRKIAETAIQRARGLGYILLPDGVDIEAMSIATRGETEYQEAIEDYRKEIFLAQTGSYLFAMEGAESHAAGNSETHRSTLDLAVWYLCSIFEEILNDQIIPWLVLLNLYNVDLPRCSIGGVTDGDLKASLEIDMGLYNMGLGLNEEELYERYNRSPGNLKKAAGMPELAGPGSGQGQLPNFSAADAGPEIPRIQQTTNYTCGPVALLYAVNHFRGNNDEIGEVVFSHELGTTAAGGTSPADLVRVAKQYGVEAETAGRMALSDIRRFTEAGKLVITPIQSGGDPESRLANQEGHYVVVQRVDADAGMVGYFDPATGRDTEWVPVNHFVTNWHDRDDGGRLYTRFGIVVSKKKSDGVAFNAGPHEFACIMAMADEATSAKVQELQSAIEDADLAGDGLETEPHVTVLYGCGDEELPGITATLQTLPPFKVTYGSLFVLKPEWKPDCEVLAVRVYSQPLEDLHHKLIAGLGITPAHEDFTPHLTVAYLKPGASGKYLIGNAKHLFTGDVGLADQLTFSDTTGLQSALPLGGAALLPGLQEVEPEVAFSQFDSKARGPFQGPRGGQYWILPSGEKTYEKPGDGRDSKPAQEQPKQDKPKIKEADPDQSPKEPPKPQPEGREELKPQGSKTDFKKTSNAPVMATGEPAAVHAAWSKHFPGTDISAASSLVGAPDDAKVNVGLDSKGRVTVSIEHKDFKALRSVRSDGNETYLLNHSFEVNPEAQSKGIGADVFSRQVEAAGSMGLGSIRCHAAKNRDKPPPFNGFYTWPRFGYDMPLKDEESEAVDRKGVFRAAQKAFPQAKTVLDIMQTEEGRTWWKQNGTDMVNARFDLKPGSRSMQVLDAYREERRRKKST